MATIEEYQRAWDEVAQGLFPFLASHRVLRGSISLTRDAISWAERLEGVVSIDWGASTVGPKGKPAYVVLRRELTTDEYLAANRIWFGEEDEDND